MEEEVLELRALADEGGEFTVAEQVRELVPVAGGVEALEREIVGVVGGFTGFGGPADEGAAETVADLLLLLIEDLLGHFFPCEAEVADGGDHAETDGAALGEDEVALIVVVVVASEEVGGGLMG